MSQPAENLTPIKDVPNSPRIRAGSNMDKLLAIGNSILNYATPAHKRRRTTTYNSHSLNETPISALNYQAVTEPRGSRDIYYAENNLLNQKYLSPSDTNNPYSRKRRRDSVEDYVESENSSAIGPEDSASNIVLYDDEDTVVDERLNQRQRPGAYVYSSASEDEGDLVSESDSINLAPEDEQAIAREVDVSQDVSREELFARRQRNIEEARAQNWNTDELEIYARLTMRGFEPLMPTYWRKDFRTCPDFLFTDEEKDWVIRAHSGNEYRGIKTLTSLTTLGGRVRDSILFHKSPEIVMKKEIDACIKWAERDGGYRNLRFIPLLVNMSIDRTQPVDAISKSIIDQMNFLAVRYRQLYSIPPPGLTDAHGNLHFYSKRLPVIYGLLAVGATTVFVTMDAASTDHQVRTIAEFNFSDVEMDVWNGIALMMIICFVKSHLVAMRHEMEADVVDDSDPDA